ncbi:MAG TPA: hypothetical protein VFA04_22360 [Bryobacteraceae bacterium]|nr:hypothetical protein [Bryobacteraceae bacterium]
MLCLLFAFTVRSAHQLNLRLGLGILSVWCLYYAIQSYRWLWPGRANGGDEPLSATVEVYRRQLEKQRDLVRHIWWRAGLTFCILGLALIVVPELVRAIATPRLALNVAPVLVVLAIWLAVFIPQRRRKQQKLQREIDELRAFERDNG